MLSSSQQPEPNSGINTDPANRLVPLSSLYSNRFSEAAKQKKDQIWQVLCKDFFQKYVKPTDTVLDLGAGYCEFINHIHCATKIAVDLSEDTPQYAHPDVKVIQCPGNAMTTVPDISVDVVFTSNFFEHMPTKVVFQETLQEIFRILQAGGRLLTLQPNIRFLQGEYWDFLDHHIPLTDRTMVEALTLTGFTIQEVRPRFLPYTTKSRLPQHPRMVWLYLHIPLAHYFLGKQAWIVARK